MAEGGFNFTPSAVEAIATTILAATLGEPNKHMSVPGRELRFGSKGSLSIDLQKATYFDNEDNEGGGILELMQAYAGMDKSKAIGWLENNGYLPKRERPNGRGGDASSGIKVPGGFPDWMEPKPIAVYEYHDERGRLAYQILKFPKDAPRRFQQRRPHPAGGWIWKLKAGEYGKTRSGDWFLAKEGKAYEATSFFDEAPRFLYHLREVKKAVKDGRTIFLVEGEKDVETLRGWGLVATCNPGGSNKWLESFTEVLAGAHVVIVPDFDKAGSTHVTRLGGELTGRVATLRVLDLSKHWKEMPDKADVTDWKDDAGGTKEQFEKLVDKAPAWKPERPRSRFGAVTWDSLDESVPDPEYLIDGWLTEGDRSVVGGPSGSGKSFLAIHMAMCVSRGVDFFAYPTKKRGVIYQAGEGGRGIKKRLKAYRKHFSVEGEDLPFVLLPAKVDLFSTEGDTPALIEEIKAWALTMTDPLGLVVIDTLATATAGADENSGKDMSIVLANIARIADECRCHVMLVHHMNAEGKKLRGHTSIYANIDQVISVTSDPETRIKQAVLAKQKDDDDGVKIPFKLEPVTIGYNATAQRDVTSCVVLSVSESERLRKQQEINGYSPNPTERRILSIMFDAVDRYGIFVASEKDGPAAAVGKTVVSWEAYKEVALERLIDAADEDAKRKAVDRIRKELHRSVDKLIKNKVVGAHSPHIWWEGKPIRGFPRTFTERRQRELELQADEAYAQTAGPLAEDEVLEF